MTFRPGRLVSRQYCANHKGTERTKSRRKTKPFMSFVSFVVNFELRVWGAALYLMLLLRYLLLWQRLARKTVQETVQENV